MANVSEKREAFRAPSNPHPSLSHKAGEGKRIQTALLCRAIVTNVFCASTRDVPTKAATLAIAEERRKLAKKLSDGAIMNEIRHII